MLDHHQTTCLVSSASFFEIQFGFEIIYMPPQQLCPDILSGCPLSAKSNLTIQKSVNLSRVPLYPLADITAQYSAVNPDSTPLLCIRLAPIGYQHPVWKNVFLYFPIGFTISAAAISLIASLTRIVDVEHDIFLFSSNYAMLPGVLRLKTPGFFDLMYYAQFIVIAGQFNIDYPRFHALFTSNFSWSFLLFKSKWLSSTISRLFEPQETADRSVPGLSIYKRQLDSDVKNLIRIEGNSVQVAGTGMSDFATAVDIDINALFFTVLVYFLIIIASCLVLCSLIWLTFYLIGTFTKHKKFVERSLKMWDFTIGVLVRILTLLYLPLITMAYYQLMIPTYWFITALAAIMLVGPFLFYGFVAIRLLQIRPRSFIFTELKLLLRYGALYNTFTDDQSHFFIILIAYKSIIAAMIGLFQTSGTAQLVLVILAETVLLLLIILAFPYADKTVNIIHIIFGFIRLLVLILNIPYLPEVKATTQIKQYVGYVQLAIHCLAFFLFFVLQVKNVVVMLTGLGEDELDESGRPPARMVIWRKRKYGYVYGHSAATLMSTSSGPQSGSLYLPGTLQARSSSQGPFSSSRTVDLLTQYHSVGQDSTNNNSSSNVTTVMKPDEVQETEPNELINQEEINRILRPYTSLVAEYRNATSSAQPEASSSSQPNPAMDQSQKGKAEPKRSTLAIKITYREDNTIVSSSQPLISPKEEHEKQPSSPPPPLPKHEAMDASFIS
ncbi:hypothetical protein RMATCC62417_12677 [Rhizopus microsporus]|nr:hypothetical protein RMATCC62417_12677 [Rhizopus microsporus]